MAILLRGAHCLHVNCRHRGTVTRWRDDKIDIDIRTGDRLEGFLDEAGESVRKPVLGELAWHTDPVGVVVGGKHRGVLQPHVVGPLGQLEPQLLLDLRPDLVLVQLMPPWGLPKAGGEYPGLWKNGLAVGEDRRLGSANAVDNLGPT